MVFAFFLQFGADALPTLRQRLVDGDWETAANSQ